MSDLRPTPLRAGPLTLIFVAGDLRYIRLGQVELLRRVYVAVRDHNWGTVPAVISELEIAAAPDRFQIRYLAEHRAGPLDFAWRASISGGPDGRISFCMEGAARSDFLRNRIGICVHYPPECAGAAARISHADGRTSVATFPLLVEPQRQEGGRLRPCPPFADVRALSHEYAPGQWAGLELGGERFELEDQRNWIDGSFKLYGTPLGLPFPVEIAAGTLLSQSAVFAPHPQPRSHRGSGAGGEGVSLALAPLSGTMPRLGLGVASHNPPPAGPAAALLRALSLSHLRVELDITDDNFPAQLARARAEAAALGLPLELALLLSDAYAAELAALAARLRPDPPPIALWLPLDRATRLTRPGMDVAVRRLLGDLAPRALVAGGSDAFFAELNRARPQLSAIDTLCYAACPSVHADDERSLAETPAGLAATVQTARAFSGGLPVAVGPITLRPRFNPAATGPAAPLAPGQLPPEVDPRQRTLFAAGWTLAALAALVAAGAARATFYETSGWRGLIERPDGPPIPTGFPSRPGEVFPLYHLFAALADFAGAPAAPLLSADPLRLAGLRLRAGERERVLIANLAAEQSSALLSGWGHPGPIRRLGLSPSAGWQEHREPRRPGPAGLRLELPPYGLVLLEAA